MGDVRRMELIGGHVALDFVNTLGGSPDRADDEYVFEYEDLLTWLARAGLLTRERHRGLGDAAAQDPAGSVRVLDDVRDLRGSLDGILRCHLADEVVDNGHLEVIRFAYAEAADHALLEQQAASYRLSWNASDTVALRWPVWTLAHVSMALLTSAPLHLLGRCQHCRWMFLDHSRNHTRRWCSMKSCGAIMKMRRYRDARST
jgi:predicted RNA-binding Zn ribbon-like protein